MTKGKTEFPPVKGLNLNQLWRPYSDSMVLQTTDLPISMFDERASLKGSMILTSDALTGAGELDFLNATALSDKFAFTANAFYSDTTKLKLRSLPPNPMWFLIQKTIALLWILTQKSVILKQIVLTQKFICPQSGMNLSE